MTKIDDKIIQLFEILKKKQVEVDAAREIIKYIWYLFVHGPINIWFHKEWNFGFWSGYYNGFIWALRLGFVTINLYEHHYDGKIPLFGEEK